MQKSIPLLKTFQLFLLDSGTEDDADHPTNWFLTIARVSASLLFVVVSFAIIGGVVRSVRELPQMVRRSDHVVICGLGRIGLQLLQDLFDVGRIRDVVVIDNSTDSARRQYVRSLGATIVIGDATEPDVLREARIERAAEVFAVTGSDGANLEIGAEINLLLHKHGRIEQPLRLFAHIVDVSLAGILRSYCADLHDSELMKVSVFNVPKTAATKLVVQDIWPFTPKQKDEVAHFVLVGFGAMAQLVTVQLAQLGHFRNRNRSRFTIASKNVYAEARDFLHRFPRFTQWSDEEPGVKTFEAKEDSWDHSSSRLPEGIRIDSPDAVQYVCNAKFDELPAGCCDERFTRRLAADLSPGHVKPIIFVCGERDRENFETAVELRDQLNNLNCKDVQIFVWLPQQPALAESLLRKKERGGGLIVPFGKCADAASYQEITNPLREIIGGKIHEDYRRLHSSGKPWALETDDFQESSRVAADHMLIKLANSNYRIVRTEDTKGPRVTTIHPDSNPGAKKRLAQMEHNRFLAERLLSGWRYVKKAPTNEEVAEQKSRKLNSTLVPWNKLGEEEQKDFEQVDTILRECLDVDGFHVERISDDEYEAKAKS